MQVPLLELWGEIVADERKKARMADFSVWELQEIQETVSYNLNGSIENNQSCVCAACVMCKSATPDSKPVHIIKNDLIIQIGDLDKLSTKDITLEKPFAGCKCKGRCIMNEKTIENQEWYDISLDKNTVNGLGELKRESSYMICTVGPGIIYFVSAGQNLKDFISEVPTQNIRLIELAQLMKCMEIGDIYNLKNKNYINDNGVIVGIEIQNAEDGYVTIGYGHAIQSNADASKYGFDVIRSKTEFKNFDFSVAHSVEEINKVINEQKAYYANAGQQNPAELSLEKAEILLLEELSIKRNDAVKAIGANSIKYSKNMIDAVTSVLYNGNDYKDPDSFSYNLINGSVQDALNILHTAENNGWYGDGILRRRLMEFNVFYNDDYTFYDSSDFEQLKKDTGYIPK